MTQERGILVIISSPSGAGKTTLSRKLLTEFPELEFSVSYTTRPRRGKEQDGVDYHFVDSARFATMIEGNEFAEWAEVHGNRYGTSRSAVEAALHDGRDVVFDVDWQGGQALSANWPADCLMVFILPPNLDVLEQRLRRRAEDQEEVILRRLRKALEELEHHGAYEFVVINDDLDAAYKLLRAIYLVRRFGRQQRSDVAHALTEHAAVLDAYPHDKAREHAIDLISRARKHS